MSDAATLERWHLAHQGLSLTIEIADAGLRRRVTWRVDGTEVASLVTSESRVVEADPYGAVGLRLPSFRGPARRVTFHPPTGDGADPLELGLGAAAAAHAGVGGIDFDPEPGSAAALREAWIRAHPRRYAVRRGLAAAARMVAPILLLWLVGRFVLPTVPWPDWSIAWPQIPWPRIPWPEIPWPDWSLPWPDIAWPSWRLPRWVHVLVDAAKYVAPVLVALALARGEVARRRDQDRRKQSAATEAARSGGVRFPEAQSGSPASTSAVAARPAATSANDVESGESPTRRPPGSR